MATVRRPSSFAARITRIVISPRLAMRIFRIFCEVMGFTLKFSPHMYTIAIHGGAGGLPAGGLSYAQERAYLLGLEQALGAGVQVLSRGGASLDAVSAAVRALEDDPLFNAGRGAALTRDGSAELDASIMEG